MQNFVAQQMRRFGLAPKNKEKVRTQTPSRPDLGGNAPLSHMEIDGRWSYSTLQYPLDIQSRSDLGHYMMFYINVPNHNDSKFGNQASDSNVYGVGTANIGGESYMRDGETVTTARDPLQLALSNGTSESTNSGTSGYNKQGRSWKAGETNKVIARQTHQGTASKAMGQKARLKRTNDAIVLYMPPQIVMNTMATYKESELGTSFGMGLDAVEGNRAAQLQGGSTAAGIQGFKDVMKIGAEQAKKLAKDAFAQSGNDVIGGMQKMDNLATNNFMEVMFGGVGFRKFSYTWKFSPKTPQESAEIDKIIRTFRFHMLPEKKGESLGRYYILPSEFDIFYMFRGEENTWFNKISTCVLVNADVNYAPNGYQTFRPHEGRNGAPPTEIDFKLDFMETRLITKEDVLDGY